MLFSKDFVGGLRATEFSLSFGFFPWMFETFTWAFGFFRRLIQRGRKFSLIWPNVYQLGPSNLKGHREDFLAPKNRVWFSVSILYLEHVEVTVFISWSVRLPTTLIVRAEVTTCPKLHMPFYTTFLFIALLSKHSRIFQSAFLYAQCRNMMRRGM